MSFVSDYPRHSLAPSEISSTSRSAKKNKKNRTYDHRTDRRYPFVAPWPFSYGNVSFEVEMLDSATTAAFPGAVTLIDLKGKEPSRCLDLGTGVFGSFNPLSTGETPHLYVQPKGYDLVDIQIPLNAIPPDDARRIQWVHGNLTTDRLPFKDEEFDHVRAAKLALGLPESKWVLVFDEIRRVMKPGATIEVVEEDAIFPVLPRWFTEPLHARTRWPSNKMKDDLKLFPNPQMSDSQTAHEYELLEVLFYRVFERRFINTRPSSLLPAYFSTAFSHVVSPPVITIPMPPIPAGQQHSTSRNSLSSSHQSRPSGERAIFYDAAAIANGELYTPSLLPSVDTWDFTTKAKIGSRPSTPSGQDSPVAPAKTHSATPTPTRLVRSRSQTASKIARNDSATSLRSMQVRSQQAGKTTSTGHAKPPALPLASKTVTTPCASSPTSAFGTRIDSGSTSVDTPSLQSIYSETSKIHDMANTHAKVPTRAPAPPPTVLATLPRNSSWRRSVGASPLSPLSRESSEALRQMVKAQDFASKRSSGSSKVPPPPAETISAASAALANMNMPTSESKAGSGSLRASVDTSSLRSFPSESFDSSKQKVQVHDLAGPSTSIGGGAQVELVPLDALYRFNVHSLCLHLRAAVNLVLAMREAMWEELAILVKSPNPDVNLDKYGFGMHEDTLDSLRSKYVQLLDQYESDMHVRMFMWHSLMHIGWDYPQRDVMSQVDETEELRFHEDIIRARRRAGTEDEAEPPCRCVRIIVGAKA